MNFGEHFNIDPVLVQAGAVVTSVASSAGAVATHDLAVPIFGVPVNVVLAAVAGAAGVLGFLPAMQIARALASVLLAMFAGIAGSGPAMKWLVSSGYAEFGAAQMFVALAISALVQVFLPLLIARRDRLADRVIGAAPPADDGKGGQP